MAFIDEMRAEGHAVESTCRVLCEPLLSQPEGVISTRTGWMGGHAQNPTEENDGGHAETIEVVFDPDRLSFRGLLEVFFQVHRADLAEDVVGSIYRSEIFCTSEEQQSVAEEIIRDVDASGHWLGKTVTRISPAGVFWEDGSEHQNYLKRFPDVFRAPFLGKQTAPRTRVRRSDRSCRCHAAVKTHGVQLVGSSQ